MSSKKCNKTLNPEVREGIYFVEKIVLFCTNITIYNWYFFL